MKINKRFNVIGTIGNHSDLYCVPRVEPTHSYHLMRDGKEIAIRYDARYTTERPEGTTVVRKPIFHEIAPNVYQ